MADNLSICRGRHFAKLRFQAQPDQLVSPIPCKRMLLAPHRLVRPSHHLSLGYSHQRYLLDPLGRLRFRLTERAHKLRSGHSRDHHLLRLCRYPRTHLVHHHRRDFLSPSPRLEHWCWSCRILCGRDPDDLLGLEIAEPNWMERGRQVRLCLGRYRRSLLVDGLLLPSGNEAPLLS